MNEPLFPKLIEVIKTLRETALAAKATAEAALRVTEELLAKSKSDEFA